MKTEIQNKKEGVPRTLEFEVRDIIPLVVIIGVSGIVAAFVAQIQGDVSADFTAGSTEANISSNALEGTENLSSRFGTIGLIAGVVIVITMLVRNLRF
jgi:hypothetical protein